jgi:hypothetical protein
MKMLEKVKAEEAEMMAKVGKPHCLRSAQEI